MSSPTNDSQATTTQQKANLKPDSDAFKALELEYFKKRRELERKHKAALRTDKAKDIADSKKLVKVMRKRYAMTDDQIAKRLGLKLSVN